MDEQRVTKLLNVQELAALLNVPVSWVYQRSRRNAIPIARRVGKYLRFDPAEVERWVHDGCPEVKVEVVK